MGIKNRKTFIQTLDYKLNQLRTLLKNIEQKNSWLKIFREAYNLNYSHVANIMGVSSKTVKNLEVSEQYESISIKSLRKIANAFDSDLYYFIIPRKPIEDNLHRIALENTNDHLPILLKIACIEPNTDSAEKAKQQVLEVFTYTPTREYWNLALIDKESLGE